VTLTDFEQRFPVIDGRGPGRGVARAGHREELGAGLDGRFDPLEIEMEPVGTTAESPGPTVA
jgi:hypothetical protein